MSALPALLVASGHTGVPTPRTGPEPSDIALFLLAALALWFVRRALRRRAIARRADGPDGSATARRD